MRKIREILRLKFECQCSNHLIALSAGVSSSTVSECLRRARVAQLVWPLRDGLDDIQLEALLYPPVKKKTTDEKESVDCAYIHQQLKRKSVTLMLLWQEYKEKYPRGFGYSRYCDIYRRWLNEVDVCMRQNHKAGEKCFVDYAGLKMPIIANQLTGEIKEVEIC